MMESYFIYRDLWLSKEFNWLWIQV